MKRYTAEKMYKNLVKKDKIETLEFRTLNVYNKCMYYMLCVCC